jgi:hypothetical protein
MGLDQYLYRNHFYYENESPSVIEGFTDTSKVREIKEEVGYWHKANQIHRWFVQNVQDGNDDCQEYEVSLDDLKTLRNNCIFALQNRSITDSVLPIQSGFFFGSYEYNEFYFYQLDETIKIIDSVIASHPENARHIVYYGYRASW